jgi:hypothetical protein
MRAVYAAGAIRSVVAPDPAVAADRSGDVVHAGGGSLVKTSDFIDNVTLIAKKALAEYLINSSVLISVDTISVWIGLSGAFPSFKAAESLSAIKSR